MSISLSGSLLLTGSIVASGNLTTTGTITAQTLVVQTITSSIVNITGSNIFGSRTTDRQTFTGSLYITGSVGIDAASSFRFNGVGDTSHAVGYDATVDGSFLRGQNGVRFITGAGGGVERMRISSAGTASFTPNALSNAADAATINLKQNSTTANTGIYLERSGEQKGYYMYIGGGADSLIFQRNNAGTKADVMSLTRDGQVAINTTSTSTESNLFLGANTTLEGGQLTLQKGTACSCATHLDNYQDSFRVLVGTDVGSNGVHMLIDHKTRNTCFYGSVLSSAPNNGFNFRGLGFSTAPIATGGSCLVYSSLDRGLYLISISSSVTSTYGYAAFLWVDSGAITVSSVIRQACVGITTSGRALCVVNQYGSETACMTINTLNLINYL